MASALRVAVFGDSLMRDAFVSTNHGGHHLEQGLAESVSEQYDRTIDLTFRDSEGIEALLADLTGSNNDNALDHDSGAFDILILSTTVDVYRLAERAADPYEAMAALSDDLVAVVDIIISRTGAHVLIANAATFDPANRTSSLFGVDPEPLAQRAHRVDLVLLTLSRLLGVSIIDLDRITAQAGGESVIPAALELTPAGSALFRDETVRVLADYGFFDERPLAPQVGTREGSR